MSTGFMSLDCSGMTKEYSEICVLFFIRYGDFLVLVTLSAVLLSNIVYIECEISELAVSVKFSNGVAVPVVFPPDGWSTKSLNIFVVLGGTIRASSVMTGWGFAVVSFQAVFSCIVNCGKCMRPCLASMTTLLFLTIATLLMVCSFLH